MGKGGELIISQERGTASWPTTSEATYKHRKQRQWTADKLFLFGFVLKAACLPSTQRPSIAAHLLPFFQFPVSIFELQSSCF